MRFNLKWLLAILAFVGFGCTALYNANDAWALVAFGVTFLVLLTALLGVIYSTSRAYYVGMAVFGWGCLLLTQAPTQRLASTDVLFNAIYAPFSRQIKATARVDVPDGAAFVQRGPGFVYWMPVRRYFQAVGRSLFALLFAIVGGAVGQWFSNERCNIEAIRTSC